MNEIVRNCLCGIIRLSLTDSISIIITINAHTNEVLITTTRQDKITSQWFPIKCSKCDMYFSTFQILNARSKPMHPITVQDKFGVNY